MSPPPAVLVLVEETPCGLEKFDPEQERGGLLMNDDRRRFHNRSAIKHRVQIRRQMSGGFDLHRIVRCPSLRLVFGEQSPNLTMAGWSGYLGSSFLVPPHSCKDFS